MPLLLLMKKVIFIFIGLSFVNCVSNRFLVQNVLNLEEDVGLSSSYQFHLSRLLSSSHEVSHSLFISGISENDLIEETSKYIETVNCTGLRRNGKYQGLFDDAKVIVYSGNSSYSYTGYRSKTFISDDLSCSLTIYETNGVKQVKGVFFQETSGHRTFKTVPCYGKQHDELCLEIEVTGSEEYECESLSLQEAALGRYLQSKRAPIPFKLDRWDDCYEDIEDIHEIDIGIAIGSNLVQMLGGVIEDVVSYVDAIVSDTNVVYLQQLNIKFIVKELVIADTIGSELLPWDNFNCEKDILDHFSQFIKAEKSDLGLWMLIDDCHTDGPIGIGVTGSLCSGLAAGLTYHFQTGGTWRGFAHEIGHIFNASHKFGDLDQGGGIMNSGSGLFINDFQFNTGFRKMEMCRFLKTRLTCPFITVLDQQHFENLDTCGNGEIDAGEECECEGRGLSCACCLNCQLREGAVCSPFDNICCNADCFYQPTSQVCLHSDGIGYCRNGYCAGSECALVGRGHYCGVQSQELSCRKRCMHNDRCDVVPPLYYYERNLRDIRDGAFCQTPHIRTGQCIDGLCVDIDLSRIQASTYYPTGFTVTVDTNYPTWFPTTLAPTLYPTTLAPTDFPTMIPTAFPTQRPSSFPTDFPIQSEAPTISPTKFPTNSPTNFPIESESPTISPTKFPTNSPTDFPIQNEAPTISPTKFPTNSPTNFPIQSEAPTISPTKFPTNSPTNFPIESEVPTISPTKFPTNSPTKFPVHR